ncbi:hypothetical protein O181_052831 [Austropuccinia psidii MF-1]|uniref:Uncharacterized protein n=1 Tax=Austropuccinia psidii MF-1 TaxID=1389203 RepID=A0A9Q3HPM2_9BASI|nr:hypothetical protein [Austropuccinia psidii MF-1]
MAYIHGTATIVTVYIENSQHPFIIESGAHCSILAREYLNKHFPNWEKQLLPTKAKNFKSAAGKMKSIGTIIKEIIKIPASRKFYWEPTNKGCMELKFKIVKTFTLP